MADVEKPEVDSRDEGKHTGRNDLLFIEDNVDVNSVTPHDLHCLLYYVYDMCSSPLAHCYM